MSAFEKNINIFSEEQKKIGKTLLELDQGHLFAHWPPPGEKDADKKRFLDQVIAVDKQYVGGIKAYVTRAKKLLEDSRAQKNPYADFVPTVPTGKNLSTDKKESKAEFDHLEKIGLEEVKDAAFVLVAGGLGERLGYNGIKVELPSEITTETCFLQLYAQSILALESRARDASKDNSISIPLAIMTSGDTDANTQKLLKENNYFGLDMKKEQLEIIKQELVPSMSDNSAHFVLDEKDPFQLDTKPHGHGDVHMLLYSSGIAEKWVKKGKKWIVFFQDTNGLVFHAVPAALGVSKEGKMHVNSLTVPRRPGEAVGAICKLTNKKGGSGMTINVEYNQLDALLTGSGVQDKTDENGYSKFPGNINVLVFNAPKYAAELKKSHGIISEFVNPKYSNKEKTKFTKPTRLECMMQDYPKELSSDEVVGYSQFERWTSFSAVKNKIDEAIAKQKSTGIAESASTGEADIYYWGRRALSLAGAEVDVEGKEEKYLGITTKGGARVVLAPSFACTLAEVASKVKGKVKISARSTLVVEGEGVTFGDLELDGALIIKAAPGAKVHVHGLKVENKGYEFVAISETDKNSPAIPQKYLIRGYTLNKIEALNVVYDKPGNYVLSNETAAKNEGKTRGRDDTNVLRISGKSPRLPTGNAMKKIEKWNKIELHGVGAAVASVINLTQFLLKRNCVITKVTTTQALPSRKAKIIVEIERKTN